MPNELSIEEISCIMQQMIDGKMTFKDVVEKHNLDYAKFMAKVIVNKNEFEPELYKEWKKKFINKTNVENKIETLSVSDDTSNEPLLLLLTPADFYKRCSVNYDAREIKKMIIPSVGTLLDSYHDQDAVLHTKLAFQLIDSSYKSFQEIAKDKKITLEMLKTQIKEVIAYVKRGPKNDKSDKRVDIADIRNPQPKNSGLRDKIYNMKDLADEFANYDNQLVSYIFNSKDFEVIRDYIYEIYNADESNKSLKELAVHFHYTPISLDAKREKVIESIKIKLDLEIAKENNKFNQYELANLFSDDRYPVSSEDFKEAISFLNPLNRMLLFLLYIDKVQYTNLIVEELIEMKLLDNTEDYNFSELVDNAEQEVKNMIVILKQVSEFKKIRYTGISFLLANIRKRCVKAITDSSLTNFDSIKNFVLLMTIFDIKNPGILDLKKYLNEMKMEQTIREQFEMILEEVEQQTEYATQINCKSFSTQNKRVAS